MVYIRVTEFQMPPKTNEITYEPEPWESQQGKDESSDKLKPNETYTGLTKTKKK